MTWISWLIICFTVANAGLVCLMRYYSRLTAKNSAEVQKILAETEKNIKILEERTLLLQAAEQVLAQHCLDAGVEMVRVSVGPGLGTKH